MKYADDIDYLLAAVVYLGSSTYWWGRTPQYMASALSLNENRLKEVLTRYPGLFRESKVVQANGQVSFSLQARYAQFGSPDGKEAKSNDTIDPINVDKLKLLLEFIQKMAEHERIDVRTSKSSRIAVTAAIISAGLAFVVGAGSLLKDFARNPAPQMTLQCSPTQATK